MAFQLPPLPSFNVQVPDLQQKALEGAQLRNMMSEMALRQALAPGQVQAQQQQLEQQRIATQLQTMQLQGQQALTDWLKNGDAAEDVPAGNFSSNNKIATFVGVSPDDPIMNVVRSMAKHNVPAPMLVTEAQGMLQRRNEYFKGTKEEQDAQKNERTIWEERLNFLHGLPEDQRSAQLAATWPLLRENSKTDPLLRAYAANLQGHPEAIDQAYNAIVGENSVLGFRKAKAEATTAEQKVIPPGGLMSPEQTAEAAKEVTVAKAEQPLKLQLATAEAKAKQLLEGMTRPGYAFDPSTGQTTLTDQTRYLQSGGKLMGFRPITEKDVRDDTMLTNRLGDVHQKLAQYEQALQKPITDKEKGNIAGLLGGGMKLGLSTTEIPMDRVNAALNAENLKGLSANARDQLVAYRNMREALLGYKTVLSGSARGSDRQMELLDQAIPNPAVTDADFSKRSIDSFRGNLRIVGQGLPQLPGVKSPAQIENETRGVPSVGDIVDGYRFKGGDPSKKESWEKPK